LKLIISSFYF